MAIYRPSVRGSANLDPQNKEEVPMAPATNKGIIDKPSNHSVDQTVDRLKNILRAKGVALFALVDHSGEAEKVGMKMRPTKLLIFGNPKAGTPLMLTAPSIAIDLPLRILIWEDAKERFGLLTTAQRICKSGTDCPRHCCKTLQSSKHWPPKLGSSCGHSLGCAIPLRSFSPSAVSRSSRYWRALESSSCSVDHLSGPAASTSAAAPPSTPPFRNPDSHHPPQIPCASSPRLPPTARPAPSSPSTHSRLEAAPAPIARGSRTPQSPASPPVSPPVPRPPRLFRSPRPTGNS